MYDNDDADILLIESLISPNKKRIMASLGIKFRKPLYNKHKNNCKACLLRNNKIEEKILKEKNPVNFKNKLKKYKNNLKCDEIVFDFNSDNKESNIISSNPKLIKDNKLNSLINLNTSKSIIIYTSTQYFENNSDSKSIESKLINNNIENSLSQESLEYKDKEDNIIIKESNDKLSSNNNMQDLLNLESLERHVKENNISEKELNNKVKELNNNEIEYLSEKLSKKVNNFEKTKLEIKKHEISDPSKYFVNHSINSIAFETNSFIIKEKQRELKEIFDSVEQTIKSEVPFGENNDSKIYNIIITNTIYEIDTCLRISDLRESLLYGKLKNKEFNGKFNEKYFKIEKDYLICFNGIKRSKDHSHSEDALCIPNSSNLFFDKKYEINLSQIKLYLVINKKIKGVFSGLKSLFFKQKNDFIDLSNSLIKNVVDLDNEYKVIIANNEKEFIFFIPILEFCIKYNEKYYFYRSDNSSSFLRWIFTLLTRSGNPKYSLK